MSKYTFSCEHWDGGKVTVEKEIETLSDVLETFEFFLKGAGFYFNGQIDVVPLEDVAEDPYSYSEEDDEDILFDISSSDWPFTKENNDMIYASSADSITITGGYGAQPVSIMDPIFETEIKISDDLSVGESNEKNSKS